MRAFTFLVLAACNGGKVTTTTITDQGTVCLQSDGTLFVDFGTCLSSSCDTLVSQSCTATLDGTTLTVTDAAVIDSQGTTCTADCGLVQGTCTADTIDDPIGITVLMGATETDLAWCDSAS